MSALTPTRKPGTDATIAHIVALLDAYRFDGADIATVLYAAHGAMCDSPYMDFGSVNLEDVADTMSQEIRSHESEVEAPSCGPMPDMSFLNIRRSAA